MAVFLPKGTRDFLPEQMKARQMLIDRVRAVFHRFGFEPLQTPAFERIETLTGKYGDETDKLMFRIHRRGRDVTPGDCDLALRYDLTVPLARVLAMNQGIQMPFKRYQIQPVWRAERPQRGRYREFWQCDVDIAGTSSTLADAEVMAVAHAALRDLGLPNFVLRVNDRRVLSSFARGVGASTVAQELSVLIAIDKLDKVGREGVERELTGRGFDVSGLAPLWECTAVEGSLDERFAALQAVMTGDGVQGVQSLRAVVRQAIAMGVPETVLRLDPALARGADYYTGAVFEAVVEGSGVGSIVGGGRYDTLVGRFSGKDIPAVGLSLGMDRILLVMQDAGLLPASQATADVLVTWNDPATHDAALQVARALRDAGVATEIYLGSGRMKAQFKYAGRRGYRVLVLLDPSDISNGTVTLRTAKTRENLSVDLAEVGLRAKHLLQSLDPAE